MMDITAKPEINGTTQAAPRQRILSATITRMIDAEKLSGKLQALGSEGWRIQQASTIVSNKYIGGFYSPGGRAYCGDTYYLVLEQTDSRYSYDCVTQKRLRGNEGDVNSLNKLIDSKNQEGYRLALLLDGTAIGPDEEAQTIGTLCHVLIFEKRVAVE